jgi:hypothetical protein
VLLHSAGVLLCQPGKLWVMWLLLLLLLLLEWLGWAGGQHSGRSCGSGRGRSLLDLQVVCEPRHGALLVT